MDNTTFNHFIGIDISKQYLDCWQRPCGGHLHCGNAIEGFNQLHTWLLEQDCSRENTIICMENTGIYGARLLVALSEHGWKCAVEKTTVLAKVSPEHHRKDDVFDAKLLAEYADRFIDRLHLQEPPEEAISQLHRLYGERRRLIGQQTATLTKQTQSKQRPHQCRLLQEGWQQQLELLKQQIQTLENKIKDIIDSHKGLKAYYSMLIDIPGVGEVTATLWLVLFYGQEKLNPKKIASRFGFAPHSRRSGSSVRGKTRSSGHGHSEMRANMALAVRSASTHYKRFKGYKQRKEEEGKPWGIIRNNMINKLITIICAIWNSGQPYDPNHQSRFNRQKNAA